MTTTTRRETLGFQTEVRQLLHLMIHSLYSNKEIFLRELISNASDAADKLRFESLAKPELLQDDTELGIRIETDKDERTITITDNGIGMSRDELVEHLGTIARSGTAEFLQQMTGDEKQDAKLIGQFGVGFYSAFIVASKVVVETRRAGLAADEAVRWESDGQGEFTIESIERAERGTAVTLHLKEEEAEFAVGRLVRTVGLADRRLVPAVGHDPLEMMDQPFDRAVHRRLVRQIDLAVVVHLEALNDVHVEVPLGTVRIVVVVELVHHEVGRIPLTVDLGEVEGIQRPDAEEIL